MKKIKFLSHETQCVYNSTTTVYTQKQNSCVTLNYEAVTSLFSSLFDSTDISSRRYYNLSEFFSSVLKTGVPGEIQIDHISSAIAENSSLSVTTIISTYPMQQAMWCVLCLLIIIHGTADINMFVIAFEVDQFKILYADIDEI